MDRTGALECDSGNARHAAESLYVPGWLRGARGLKRKRRARLSMPSGLRKPDHHRRGRREVRAVPAGLLQGAAAQRELRAVRDVLVDAARGQHECGRLCVRSRTLAGAGRGGLCAMPGADLEERFRRRAVHGVSARSLLPGG